MKSYVSRSSTYVKLVTIGTLMLLTIILSSLFVSENPYGMFGGIVLTVFTIGTVVYFYANSLNKIIIDKDYLILKKNLGQIKIAKQDIISIAKMGYSNVTMSYGSKGVFGFNGNTMDNAYSLVKDRNKMVKITTKNKNYIVSTEAPDKMVSDIKRCYNIV